MLEFYSQCQFWQAHHLGYVFGIGVPSFIQIIQPTVKLWYHIVFYINYIIECFKDDGEKRKIRPALPWTFQKPPNRRSLKLAWLMMSETPTLGEILLRYYRGFCSHPSRPHARTQSDSASYFLRLRDRMVPSAYRWIYRMVLSFDVAGERVEAALRLWAWFRLCGVVMQLVSPLLSYC